MMERFSLQQERKWERALIPVSLGEMVICTEPPRERGFRSLVWRIEHVEKVVAKFYR